MVYVTGDIHGDAERFESTAAKKLKKGDTLLVCGDFGFVWSGKKSEKKLLKKIGKLKYNVCFIDGTHENFDLLNEYEVTEWNGGKVQNISGNLYHLMRGQVFEIEGLKIFTMGGGESPDIDLRFENNTWFREEIPSPAQLREGIENLDKNGGKVDIIITHEPPAKIKSFLTLKDKDPVRITAFNQYLEQINDNAEFSKWYFGSMHRDKYISSSHTALFTHIVEAQSGEQVKK